MVFIHVARFIQANFPSKNNVFKLDLQMLQIVAVVGVLAARVAAANVSTRGCLYDVSAVLQCAALCTSAAHIGARGDPQLVSSRHGLAAVVGAVLRIIAQPDLSWEDHSPQVAIACLAVAVLALSQGDCGGTEGAGSRLGAAAAVFSCAFPGTLRFRVVADVACAVGSIASVEAATKSDRPLPLAVCVWALLSQVSAIAATLALGGWVSFLACGVQAIPFAVAGKDLSLHVMKVSQLKFV